MSRWVAFGASLGMTYYGWQTLDAAAAREDPILVVFGAVFLALALIALLIAIVERSPRRRGGGTAPVRLPRPRSTGSRRGQATG